MAEIGRYRDQGYCSPVTVLSPNDAAAFLSRLDRAAAGRTEAAAVLKMKSHLVFACLDELLHLGSERGDKMTLGEALVDRRAEDPGSVFEAEETRYILADAITTLPEREKTVITLYYYEGLTLNEIGQVLGVTESRACQIHTKSVLQLRAKMADIVKN